MGEALREWRVNWGIGITSLVGAIISVGHIFSLGILMPMIERDTGWSRSAVSASLLVVAIVVAVFSPIVGRLVDKGRSRVCVLAGATLYSIALIMLGLVPLPYLVWMGVWVLVATGASAFTITVWTAQITRRFVASRGLSLAIVMCGAGVAGFIYPVAASALLSIMSWRHVYVVLGMFAAVATLPAFFLWVHEDATSSPAPLGQMVTASSGSVFKTLAFAKLAFIALVLTSALVGLQVHFAPALMSMGSNSAASAQVASLLGIGAIVSRLVIGLIIDRKDYRPVGAAVFLAPALGVFLLAYTAGVSSIVNIFVALLIGAGLGGQAMLVAFVTGRIFGVARFGSVWGVLISLMSIASGIGPVVAGEVFDRWHEYSFYLYGAGLIFVVSALMILSLRPEALTGRVASDLKSA
ncbi:MFS transporter [Sphingobium sp. V4]|uniref:MFS transporter n=1 Tax=Sphingobium sp. V4 TaxID=3038927 RepID=UPI002557F8F6|nr:MFS transporter [Sphingobium sp. V4]WIW89496.1 MFS transporter [Sphingobium sp. V4]